MADAPAGGQATADNPFPELTKEANERLAACEAQKREFNLDIREGYFFAQPHRSRTITSAIASNPSKPADAADLNTGKAMELSKDFLTVLVNTFMPVAEPWAERRPGMFIPDALVAEAKKKAGEQDPKIFAAIRSSNLYQQLPMLGADPAIGTAALWIDDLRPSENIVVQAIPLHELEINIGPYGGLDDRFVVRHTKNRHVKALLGEDIWEKLDAECRKKIDEKPDSATILRWGYWRKWDVRSDVCWQHVVMLDTKVRHHVEIKGEGSCPLLPFRFNPSPEWAYGQGPLLESLPDLRQLDDLQNKKMEHVDLTLAPPFTYPSDSSTAWGNLESGKGYPVQPGTAVDVKNIFDPGSMEPAIYEVSDIERALRHRFFLDWPEQRGDTPPTATQWLDEMQLAQRRIGTPGSSFWQEGPAEIFLRFKYLLEKRGVIEPIKVNGKVVSLEPYNPAQRASEQQEVMMFARFAELMGPLLPEEWKIETDGKATMLAVAQKMRVTDLWKQRSEADKKQALAAIMQLTEGRQQVRPSDPAGVGMQ